MIVLGLDTSGTACSVSVCNETRALAQFTIQNQKTHSQTLMPLVDMAVSAAGIEKSAIDAIAVSEGPGSFTGLRIGASTAKALALALDIPVIGVPTLAALACNLPMAKDLICPVMDARRSQVYAGLFRLPEESGIPQALMSGAPTDVHELIENLNERGEAVVFLGDGVPVYAQVLREELRVPFSFAPLQYDHQDASSVAFLALQLLNGEENAREACKALKVHEETADAFTPVYLRPAQAERESVVLRPMEARDVKSAYALECASFTRPWTEQMLQDVVADEDSIAVVAVVGEKDGAPETVARIIGTCFVKNIAGEGCVTNVNVDRDFRRQGIGEAMMEILLDEGKEAGINAFTLEVRTGNTAARKLYEKCGFVSEGVRPGFYEDPKEDAEIYWLRND